MNRNRFIYFTDLVLVSVFVLSFYTGVQLHIAGEGISHEIWHDRAVLHTVVSLLFMIVGIIHVKSHWGWYKGLKKTGCKGKKKVVLSFSIIFLSVVISGLVLLLFIDGANSPIGSLHYKIGIAMGILGIFHLLKRKRIFYKGVSTHIFGRKKEGRI